MKKKLIAITGGLATGKSTVLNIIKELGFSVLSCDDIVKDLYTHKEIKENIKSLCDIDIFNTTGEIDRKKLLLAIIKDSNLKKRLEQFLHPLVWKEIQKRILQDLADKANPIFIEVPLLFEANWDKYFDEIWVVSCSEQIQKERILKRQDPENWLLLATLQIPIEEKIKRADRVISSEKPLDELREELKDILSEY